MATMNWKPSWWREDRHGSAWDRVREAMRRDWEQTLHDVHIKGGHELNQKVGDTMKQMTGKEPIPPIDKPNPPKIVGDWSDVELPIGYGYGARQEMGGSWSDAEPKLRGEWESGRREQRWSDVRDYVRRGFESPIARESRPSVH